LLMFEASPDKAGPRTAPSGCTEARLGECTRVPDPNHSPPTYICQTTQIPRATTPLALGISAIH
jgi:hypothetical protein